LDLVRAVTQITWVDNLQALVDCIQNRGTAPAPAVLLTTDGTHRPSQVLPSLDVSSIKESRLSVCCHVRNPSVKESGLAVFSRAWYPGYRAFLDGKELEVQAVNGLQPAVFVPPQANGELVLKFAPRSLQKGLLLALVGICLSIAGPAVVQWRCARRRGGS
jgi:hypothetical protein